MKRPLLIKKDTEGFEKLVNELPLGMLTCDRDGNITIVNDFLIRILDFPLSQENKTINMITFPPLIESGISASLKEALATGNNTAIETFYTTKSGKELFVSFRAFPLKDENGSTCGCHIIVEDLTDKENAEKHIARSDKRYRSLLEQLAEAIFITDTEGYILEVNNNACEMLGYSKEELEKMNIHDLLIPERREKGLEAMKILQRKGSVYGETKYVTAKGDIIDVELTARLLEGKQGTALGVVRDITERKKSERKLAENEEMLRLLIEHSPLPLIMLDRDMKHIAASRNVLTYFALGDVNIIGKNHYEVFPSIDNDYYRAVHQRAMKGEIVREDEEFMALPDGKITWSRWEARPWKTANDTIGGIVIFFEEITERKLAQDKLRESEEKLRLFIEHAPAALAMVDRNMRYIAASHRWITDYFLDDMDIVGKCHYDIFPEIPEEWKEMHQKALNGEVIPVDETAFERLDGRVQWVRGELWPWKTADDTVGGIIFFSEDITEHKIAEQKLLESEARVKRKLNAILEPEGDISELELADIIDHETLQLLMNDFYRLTHIGVGIIDLKGKVMVATGWQDICTNFHRENSETCRYCVESDLELTQNVIPGTFKYYKCKNNMWDISTPIIIGGSHVGNLFLGQFFFEDEEIPYDSFRIQAKKYGFDEKEYLDALDRVPRWSREKVADTMEFYKRLTNIISSLSYSNIKLARTLKERDELLGSLRQSESRFRSYVEQAPEGVFITDEKSNYIEVNEAASRMTGYSIEELLKMNMTDLAADKEKALSAHRVLLKNGHLTFDGEVFTRDGKKRSWTVKAVRLSETRFLGFASDITERKLAEEAMLAAKIEAETASRTKSEFLATMSHELRTPLNSIIGFSDIMLNSNAQELDHINKHYLKYISDSGDQLLSLINSILDISKIESEKMELNYEMLNMKTVIEEIVIVTRALASKKNLTVDVDLPDDLPDIMADKPKIKQVLYNLVGNAIKFTDNNGKIIIHSRLKDRKLQVSVIDTGIGISPNDHEKLFKPFSQIDSSISRKYEGTGLGLALVKQIIELHNGQIWVESEVGGGSSFIFELPINNKDNKGDK